MSKGDFPRDPITGKPRAMNPLNSKSMSGERLDAVCNGWLYAEEGEYLDELELKAKYKGMEHEEG